MRLLLGLVLEVWELVLDVWGLVTLPLVIGWELLSQWRAELGERQ